MLLFFYLFFSIFSSLTWGFGQLVFEQTTFSVANYVKAKWPHLLVRPILVLGRSSHEYRLGSHRPRSPFHRRRGGTALLSPGWTDTLASEQCFVGEESIKAITSLMLLRIYSSCGSCSKLGHQRQHCLSGGCAFNSNHINAMVASRRVLCLYV